MAKQNHAFEMEDFEVESETGIQLEKIVWDATKELHHRTMKEKDGSTTHQNEEIIECQDCIYLATSRHINWSQLKIRHKDPNYTSLGKPKKPTSVQLFESSYTNKTSRKQLFSFKTSKKTTSSATIEIKRPVLYGTEGCKLSLKLPEAVTNQTTVFGNQLGPSKSLEQFKEELEWSIDNLIDCPPKKTTKASFLVSEQKHDSNFAVETTVSGKVAVILNEENNPKTRYIYPDIAEVIQKYEAREHMGFFCVDGKKVRYTTEGSCKFNYGVEQYVTVETVNGVGCTIL